ncbi:conjugal transfer protein TraL [Vibrio owensii]|uniref:conjugal transfer protein TraL n=1 Tax=Vibrio TaxID=662 RepID=UPI0022DD707C|nr:conjugal transfer protein TraL [Vibrio owensii]MDA0385575.1 conjugal transfer protein TraL [Vibrio owensii]
MKPLLMTAALSAAFLLPTTSTYAASENECAIWLCLPAAFAVDGCGAAKDAFIDRIKHFKPPLPSFTSCMYAGDLPSGTPDSSEMSSVTGSAAYVPAREECKRWGMFGNECMQSEIIPSHIVKNQRCKRAEGGERNPRYCTKTINYVQTKLDGQLYGEPYYYDNNGGTYLEGSTQLEN